MEVQPPTSSSHSQATDLKSSEKFDAMSFANRMSSFDQTCSCCPYGYHIDLDFLRYLDSLYSADTLKRLKKARCGKDASLPRSVEPQQHAPQLNQTSPAYTSAVSEKLGVSATSRRTGKEVTVELDISQSNEPSRMLLSPPVSPNSDSKFRSETELFITNSSESRDSLIRSTVERFEVSQSAKTETYSEPSVPERLIRPKVDDLTFGISYRPFSRGSSSSPVESDASSGGISPAVLQAIREQMAMSLRRMKELEEQVKVIPALKARVATLARENRDLARTIAANGGGSSGGQRMINRWTQTEGLFGAQDAMVGRREVDVNFNRVSEDGTAVAGTVGVSAVGVTLVGVSPAVVSVVEVSSEVVQNIRTSQEAKYYSIAIQCRLLSDDTRFEGGAREEMTSVAVEVRPTVISRCVGTDDGFLWYPPESGSGDEQRLARWMELGVDTAARVDRTADTTSQWVPCGAADEAGTLRSLVGESKVIGEAFSMKRRLEEDSGEDSVEEEVFEYSDHSFEFEAAVGETELSSDDIGRLASSVKAEGADPADEDVVVEKAVGAYVKLVLERDVGVADESDASLEMEQLFAAAKGVWLGGELDRRGTKESLGTDMSRAGNEAETKDEGISDDGRDGDANDEDISHDNNAVEIVDDEISDAGIEAEAKYEEISDVGIEAVTKNEEISYAVKSAINEDIQSIEVHAAVESKYKEVLGEDAEAKPENEDQPKGKAVGRADLSTESETEFLLIGDQIIKSTKLESRRGTMSLETNLEVLMEHEVEKEEELDTSVEISLENKNQEQEDQEESVVDVDVLNSEAVGVVTYPQVTVSVSEENVNFDRKIGIEDEGKEAEYRVEDEGVLETGKEARCEDRGISDTDKDVGPKNEDISDVGRVAGTENEEISVAGEAARNKDTELTDLHAALGNKDDGVLAEENEGAAYSEETRSEEKPLMDEETKAVLRGEKLLDEDTLETFTDSEKECGEDICDTDSDMTRTDEESCGSYEVDWVTRGDRRVILEEDIMVAIETGQEDGRTSMVTVETGLKGASTSMVTIETGQEGGGTDMTKRNEMECLVETHEEMIDTKTVSADVETPMSVVEAGVVMDAGGETIETEVAVTTEVTKNVVIGDSEWKRDDENILKSFEVAANTTVQEVHEEKSLRVQELISGVEGTSHSSVAVEEQVVGEDSEGKKYEVMENEKPVFEVRVSKENESEFGIINEKDESVARVIKLQESEVRVQEEKMSEVRILEENKSETRVSKENELDVSTPEELESEVRVPEETEVWVSEENESDVKVPEETESKVEESEVKKSKEEASEENEYEVRVSMIKESETKVFEVKESEMRVSKEEESEVNESEVMVSLATGSEVVNISEETFSEVNESEVKKSEEDQCEGNESEVKVTINKESDGEVSEENESEVRVNKELEYKVRVPEEKISDVMVSTEDTVVRVPKEKESEVRESDVKESEIKESEVKESEVNESEMKEPEVKESEMKEPEVKDSEVKESEVKESEVKESEVEESEVKVSEVMKSEVNESGVKESEVNESEVKKSEVKISEVKVSEVKESEIEESEVKESEVKESEVKVSEVKVSEVKVSEVKESEVKESEVKESEVNESEMKEPEVKESEMKEPEVKDSEVKESEVKESEVEESEVKVSEVMKSEVNESGVKESEVNESEVKKSEVKISEVKVSEVKESEIEESEVKESEVNESEVKVSEVKKSELKVSEVKESDEKELEEWELVEKILDVKELSLEESETKESLESNEEVRESEGKETDKWESGNNESETKVFGTKESEEWELVDKEFDQEELAEEEVSDLVRSVDVGISPSIDHIEIISTSDNCHESIIVSKGELTQLAKEEQEEESSSRYTVDQLSVEPVGGLVDIENKLVEDLRQCERVDGSVVVLGDNVEQMRLGLIADKLELVDQETISRETVHSVEQEESLVSDTIAEPERTMVSDANVEREIKKVSDKSVEPYQSVALANSVEPNQNVAPCSSVKRARTFVPPELNESAISYTNVETDQHAATSVIAEPAETEHTEQTETAEQLSKKSQAEPSEAREDSSDFCTVESALTSTKRVVITETRIERRRADQHGSSQGSSQGSTQGLRVIDSGGLQKVDPQEEDVVKASDSPIPSGKSQSADDSNKMAEGFVVRPDVLAACAVYAEYLRDPTMAVDSDNVVSCVDFLRNHWFDLSGRKTSDAGLVQLHLDEFQTFGTSLARSLINMADDDGNTAMHYAVSYGNMAIIEVLLNTGFCNVNRQNIAGYTAIMLASLLLVDLDQHEALVLRLFYEGDVNSTSTTSGQTSLMLAASHGRSQMVALLLQSGAEVNLQDEDGSTALMCASEHGHSAVIRTLLGHPECDSTITDVDGSTALSIAMEEGHHDIGVFLYAHMKAIDDRLDDYWMETLNSDLW